MLNGKGEWLWRPLQNPEYAPDLGVRRSVAERLRIAAAGSVVRYLPGRRPAIHRRPSLWIEPLGEWDQGSVQLLEIPTDAEINDNILAYWRPKAPIAAGSEVPFAYRQYWCWSPPERPPLATVVATRVGRGLRGVAGDLLSNFPPKPWVTISQRTLNPFLRSVRARFIISDCGRIRSERRCVSDSSLTPAAKTRVR